MNSAKFLVLRQKFFICSSKSVETPCSWSNNKNLEFWSILALKRVIRENEINKEKQRELLQKEKEEDIRAYQEMERNEMKQDLERKRYFDNIRRFANKYDEVEVNKLLNKMKQEQKEEDEKVYKLMLEQNKREEEKERLEKIKRKEEKKAIKKFLDMQLEEKRKELEMEKAINDEQARIWNADCKKYPSPHLNLYHLLDYYY